ncbi:hypothetical protein FRC17_001487 [Serendipita sp. 399]|nr:hypothetical protein FRC17_001487 [Serendipita sp. 399]
MTCQIRTSTPVGGTYSLSIFTNIVINPSHYGDASTLDYTWSFTPWLGSSGNYLQGTLQTKQHGVVRIIYHSLPPSIQNIPFTYFSVPKAAPFLHTGVVPLPTGSNNNFIHLAINISYTRYYTDQIGFYVKDAGFVINTPLVTSTASSQSSSPTESNPSGSGGSGRSSKTGAIVGGVVGGIVLIAICIAIGFYVGRRNRRRNTTSANENILGSPTSNVAVHAMQEQGWQPPLHRPERPQTYTGTLVY